MKTLNGRTSDRDRDRDIQVKDQTLVEKPILDKPQDNREPEQDAPQKPRKKLPKGLVWVVVGIGAIAAGVFGYRWWHYASTHATTDDAYIAGHVHPISSRIAGTVTDVEVNDNQEVKKGELLVKLDKSDLQVAVAKAEAALLTAQGQAKAAQANIALASDTTDAKSAQAKGDISDATANISTAKAAVSGAKAGIASAQAQVAQADADLNNAQKDYNRYSTLYKEGAVTLQRLDNAQATYKVALAKKNAADQGVDQAQAQLEQAQQTVNSANAKLASTKSQLQQVSASGQQIEANRAQYAAAQADIAQAKATLENARLQLSYANITAPTGGKVGNKTVEVGQRVQQGTPLMAVVGDDYWVTANFKETQLGEMKPGEKVEVKIDAFDGRTFMGKVNSIAPGSGAQFALLPPDNATGNFTKVVQRIPVKIVLDPQSIKGYESRISPGMSAVVHVDLPQHNDNDSN
ncbi:HlyD family secretion protein [Pleurocapsa sp. FMAR1]|uniref:HlyD family secretion protein n=1 Tax=Pleurocapsa sp. FMAR1 TaxID=3040204 RepID=UPI0029C9066D|nr:HlyD family secretion protein [Pleurocapsa sp. FMAR1]